MPVYTYRCENCGVQFEQTQKFTDQPLTRCPECGKKSLHKVYTPVGIVFKGSGFYATDHRSPSGGWHSSKVAEEKAASHSSDSSSGKTSESSKPAASSDAASSGSTPAKTESTSKDS